MDPGNKSRGDEQVSNVREHLIAKGLNLEPQAVFAVLHLQTTFEFVEQESIDNRVLFVCYEPELPEGPSHAGIYGYS